MSKCPEMIGYVGDVRNLEDSGIGIAMDNKKIYDWAKLSRSTPYATLFYSKDDVWKVGRKSAKLLEINPDLKIKQIGDVQTFIDYIYSGMDRSKHPVKTIQMINVQSTWHNESIEEYIDKKHEAEEERAKQIKETKKLVHNILLNNQTIEAYQEKYHWDESKTFADNIVEASGKAKESMDDLKDIRKGKFKTFEPIKVTIKNADKYEGSIKKQGSFSGSIKANMTLPHADAVIKKFNIASSIYDTGDKAKTASDETKIFVKSGKQIKEEY